VPAQKTEQGVEVIVVSGGNHCTEYDDHRQGDFPVHRIQWGCKKGHEVKKQKGEVLSVRGFH